MTGELIFGAGILLMLVLTVIAWRAEFNVWKFLMRLLDEAKLRKQIELETLQDFHVRLKNVTNDLLARANEMDQESKLLPDQPKEWSRTLGSTCSQLVILADQTKLIERYLNNREPRSVRQLLLGACTLAGKTGQQLIWLQANTEKKSAETALLTQVQPEGQTSSS
jgi:hypothetical protein